MNITQYKAALPLMFKARTTPLVWGYHGIGKSTAPQQFADENGHKLVNLRLGNLDAGDLIGLQDFATDQYTGQRTATKHFMPDWLHNLMQFCQANPDKWGILHLDEINHIRRDLQSFIWQICLDRRLHTFVFPENLAVIASANPPTKDYPGTLDFKNKALLSRFCHLALRPDLAETLSYYRGPGDIPEVALFLQEHPQLMNGTLDTFSVDEYCKPSARSWEAAGRLLKLGAPNELIYGLVGVTAAEGYFTWVKAQKERAVAPLDVMENYDTVRKRIKKQIKGEKYAELKILCEGIQTEIISKSAKIVDDTPVWEFSTEIGANVAAFAMDLPADLSMAFLLVVTGPESTAIMDVLDQNKELTAFVIKMMDTGKFKAPKE